MRVEDVDLSLCTDDELRRARLLCLVMALWPHLQTHDAVMVTRWLRTGRWAQS